MATSLPVNGLTRRIWWTFTRDLTDGRKARREPPSRVALTAYRCAAATQPLEGRSDLRTQLTGLRRLSTFLHAACSDGFVYLRELSGLLGSTAPRHRVPDFGP
jgi:hypothetical protein